jgi:hypothetical protein
MKDGELGRWKDYYLRCPVAPLLRYSSTPLLRRFSAPILCFVTPLQSLGTIEVSLVKFDRQAQEM